MCHVRNLCLENKFCTRAVFLLQGNGSPCRLLNHFWVPKKSKLKGVKHFLTNPLYNSTSSVRCDILARYSKFVKGLRVSPSKEVTIMCGVVAKDVQSTTGHNLSIIGWETRVDSLT